MWALLKSNCGQICKLRLSAMLVKRTWNIILAYGVVILFVGYGLRPWDSAAACRPQSDGLHPTHLGDSYLFLSEGYLFLGLGCVCTDCIWGGFGTSYGYWLLTFYATVYETVMTLAVMPDSQRVFRSLRLLKYCLSELLDFDLTCEWNMYVCVAEKQIRTMFVLDFPPCLDSREEPIIMLWQKIKSWLFFPK